MPQQGVLRLLHVWEESRKVCDAGGIRFTELHSPLDVKRRIHGSSSLRLQAGAKNKPAQNPAGFQ
jgi:hypothetical protein